ncbi:MAG TPA: hypothetical protein VGK32_23050 [Vicinamibacterales bacterium]|jgi:methylmalonyl-CoA carboxyltransferase large subunit
MVEKKAGTGRAAGARRKAGDVTAALAARIAELEERIARLESARDAAVANLVAPAPAHMAPPRLAPTPVAAPESEPLADAVTVAHEEVTEEVLLVISAAVAAFLGERAHVRQVRLVTSEAWAQQGRVSVMASHRWAVHR